MGGNTGGADGDEEPSGNQSKQRQKHRKQRYVYLFDFKYFFFAADPDQYHSLPQPVWERESGRDCRRRNCGDPGKYGGRSGICGCDGEKEKSILDLIFCNTYIIIIVIQKRR